MNWRYFEHNKVNRNELQIRKNLHKGTGTKMTEKLNNLTKKIGHFCSCAFMQIDANLEFIPINFIMFKVPPVQFWSPWSLEVTWASWGLAYTNLALCEGLLKVRSRTPQCFNKITQPMYQIWGCCRKISYYDFLKFVASFFNKMVDSIWKWL